MTVVSNPKKSNNGGGAVKNDRSDLKVRMELIPTLALAELGLVYTIGAVKYADDNWRKGMAWMRVIGAAFRHLLTYMMGHNRDADGQHHLASVMWCCATLIEYEQTHPELDDRKGAGWGNHMVVPTGVVKRLQKYIDQEKK